MIFKKTNKKQKRILFLHFLLILLLFQVIGLIYNSRFVLGWQNSHYSHTINDVPIPHSSEDISEYIFGNNKKSPDDTGHYSTHDWIGDSALRLIAMSDVMDDEQVYYRDKIKWLLVYDYPDHVDEISYKYLDDLGTTGLSEGHGKTRLWWSEEDIERCNFDPNPEQAKNKWLKNRRFIYFLHGTGYPDWNKKKMSSHKQVPAEKIKGHNAEWISDRSTAHHFWWKYDEESGLCYIDNVKPHLKYGPDRGAYLARQAAQDAIDFLNYKKKYKGSKGDYEINGKFESGALALGGMAHFIGDVSSPPHSYKVHGWTPAKHSSWDDYADRTIATRFTHTTALTTWGNIFPKGGPNWLNADPRGIGEALTPIDPYVAVMMMSLITYSACDLGPYEYMGDSAAPNLGEVTFHGGRCETLLEWSSYYTACAIMWVLDKCNDNIMGDTTSDRFNVAAEASTMKARDFAGKEALKDYQRTKDSSGYAKHISDSMYGAAVASFSPALLFASFSLLGTVSVLVGTPIAATVAEKIRDKDDKVPRDGTGN